MFKCLCWTFKHIYVIKKKIEKGKNKERKGKKKKKKSKFLCGLFIHFIDLLHQTQSGVCGQLLQVVKFPLGWC